MTKIRTSSQFSRALGDEFSWRRKELIDYRLHARTTNLIIQKTLIRAGVPLAYAHWEGFIKNGTELLLNFVSHQNLENKDLTDIFFAHSIKTHINQIISSLKATTVVEAVSFVRGSSEKRADIKHKNYVDTDSNLSSTAFDQIAKSVGIETSKYQFLYKYVDETIVYNRNQIAHGESLHLTISDFHALVDKVDELIYMYKTDLENAVITQRFKHALR